MGNNSLDNKKKTKTSTKTSACCHGCESTKFHETCNAEHFNAEQKKIRDEEEYKLLMNRLSRIEGQVRGIKNMLENDAYCVDIITQVSAVNSALHSFNKVLIENHIKSCVVNDVKNGGHEKIDELINLLTKIMK